MIKKILFIMAIGALSCAASDSLLKPINDLGYGTWAVRLQSVSMHRGYEGVGGAANVGDGHSTTLGAKIDYLSPEIAYLSGGFSYIYVEPIFDGGGRYGGDNNGKLLLSNGRVDVLNEFWFKYRLGALGLTNTFVKAGRQVINGEVFRADEFREKPRSLEAVTLTTKDIPNTAVTIGHALRLSNWMQNQEAWKFDDFGKDVFTAPTYNYDYETHGITWVEGVYKGITNLELAIYNAYAYDIANIAGGRAKYTLTDSTALNGYYRHENDVGRAADRKSDMAGVSIEQKVGDITLEPGYFGVYGDGLVFQETTTGINHPLGSLMMIYSGQFSGDSDTAYLKATTKIGKTSLYALYNYTWNDLLPYDGQELNFVIKQPIGDRLTVSLKVGAGYRDGKNAGDDTFATDTRLFVTYNF